MSEPPAGVPFHDAHNHLQHPHLDRIRVAHLARRESLGIGYQVVNGTCESDWDAVRTLAASNPSIIPAFGVHPWEVDDVTESWREHLSGHLDAGGCMGEIGLDRWKPADNFAHQQEVFSWQWREAVRREIATTVHCLRAWGALMEIVRNTPHPKPGFLLHAYGGPVEMVSEWVEHGAYFSFSASFLADGRERKLDPFRSIPEDRILVETDAPAMPPPASLLEDNLMIAPDGSTIHHPASITVAYEGLARVRNQPVSELKLRVDANFRRLFLRPQDCYTARLHVFGF